MFTENQVRQFYVVESVVKGTAKITNASDAGATKMGETADGKEFYFVYKGASEDGLQRTDLVAYCNIMDIRATAAEDMAHKMRKLELTLNSKVNEGKPIVGEDYVVTVNIKNYVANGDDSTKGKFGAAHAFTDVASDLYKTLALSLAKNFSREPVKLVKITLKGDAAGTEITNKTKAEDLNSITATGIILEEVEQPWRRGVAQVEYVNFEILPGTVYTNGADMIWGEVKDVTNTNTNVLPNSKKVADMEWFFHKERGDQYGLAGYPHNIDTIYMVDPNNTIGYSFLDIHFYYESNSHNVGHSEKTLTLVGTKTTLKEILDGESGLLAKLGDYPVKIHTSKSW